MAEIEKRGYAPPQHMEKPSHLLIVDDAQGTDLYTTCRKDLMSHMTIKHRHIPITLCFLMQSWTGLPHVIRLNATHFMLFKTGDVNQLEQIYSAFGCFKVPMAHLATFLSSTDRFFEFFVPHQFSGKKRFKKREFFMPHHLAEKKRFKKREFFQPQHLALKKKRFQKRDFFVPHHLAEKNGSKSVSFSNRTIWQKKNGSKSVSFSNRTIWQKKNGSKSVSF